MCSEIMLHFLNTEVYPLQLNKSTQLELKDVSDLFHRLLYKFSIGNSVAKPSGWDFGQKLSNSLATAQP